MISSDNQAQNPGDPPGPGKAPSAIRERLEKGRVFLIRRWPFVAAAIGIVFLGGLAISRRTHEAEGAEARDGTEGKPGADTTVTLDSLSQQLAKIEIANAAPNLASDLVANGTITYDANRVSVVASRAEGRVVSVRTDLGRSVTVGQTLAILESSEVGGTRGDLGKAQATLETARQNYEREKRLYEQQITPQKELLEAEGAYRSAVADYGAAVAKLRALGATAGQAGEYGLASPLSGIVVERNASPGQIVGPSTNLFTVADLKRVWITVDVYESDLARVRQGAPVSIVPRALPGETFRGYVTYAGGVVDTTSRTIKVRVDIDNPGLRLRPGMFAQVKIEAPVGQTAGPGVVVPELAIQDLNGRTVIFVPGSSRGEYIARTVIIGPRAGPEMVNVLTGLQPGERFVAKGAFQLKSELLKSSFGDED